MSFDPRILCMGCMNPLPEADAVCPRCGFDNAQGANQSTQLPPRTILAGKYLVGRALGQGGFGITYIGWDLNLEIRVAIKEYYPEGFVSREQTNAATVLPFTGAKADAYRAGCDRFVQEAKTVAKFSELPGIIHVRDYFKENGTAYIVMEFVDGETMQQYAARMGGKLPTQEVLDRFRPLLGALAAVHESGLLHRDISPDNVMIRLDGTLKLLDFGAARQISVAGEHANTVNVKHGYAPEEQYRTRGEQGPWTDVYALCATLYKLTTGVTPPESMDRAMSDLPLVPPNDLGADFTPEQQAAILHGLAVRAKDRTQNMAALEQELYGAAYYAAAPEPEPEPVYEPVPEPAPEPVQQQYAENQQPRQYAQEAAPVQQQYAQETAPAQPQYAENQQPRQYAQEAAPVQQQYAQEAAPVQQQYVENQQPRQYAAAPEAAPVAGAAPVATAAPVTGIKALLSGKKKLIVIAAAAVVLLAAFYGHVQMCLNQAVDAYERNLYLAADSYLNRSLIGKLLYPADKPLMEAGVLIHDEQYDEAIELLDTLADTNVSDLADGAKKEALYRKAAQQVADGDYIGAKNLYASLGSYKESKALFSDTILQYGNSLLSKRQFSEALTVFTSPDAKSVSGVKSKINQTYYEWGVYLQTQRDPMGAYEKLNKANGYSDTAKRLTDLKKTIYQEGVTAYRTGKLSDAETRFRTLPGYAQSKDYLTLIALKRQDSFSESDLWNKLVPMIGFEDVSDLIFHGWPGIWFMEGRFSASPYYIKIYQERGNWYGTWNLPNVANADFHFYDGKFYANNVARFYIEALSKDAVRITHVTNGTVFILTRE